MVPVMVLSCYASELLLQIPCWPEWKSWLLRLRSLATKHAPVSAPLLASLVAHSRNVVVWRHSWLGGLQLAVL